MNKYDVSSKSLQPPALETIHMAHRTNNPFGTRPLKPPTRHQESKAMISGDDEDYDLRSFNEKQAELVRELLDALYEVVMAPTSAGLHKDLDMALAPFQDRLAQLNGPQGEEHPLPSAWLDSDACPLCCPNVSPKK